MGNILKTFWLVTTKKKVAKEMLQLQKANRWDAQTI
jgi:hypothetical protein